MMNTLVEEDCILLFLVLLNLIVIVTIALQEIKIIINQKTLLRESSKKDEKIESSIEKNKVFIARFNIKIMMMI